MAKTHALGIRLDPAEREALEAAATADGRSMSALGRKILSDWLRDNGWTGPRALAQTKERKAK